MSLDHNTSDLFNNDRQLLYIGTVTSVEDPLNLGRVQIHIEGKTEPNNPPFFAPMRLSPFGFTGGGFYGKPRKGARMIVYAQNGDIAYGFYIADYVGLDNPIPDQFKDPNVWGFIDPGGNMLVVNTAKGTWTFVHQSGLTKTIDSNGNYALTSPGGAELNYNGIVNVYGAQINLNPK